MPTHTDYLNLIQRPLTIAGTEVYLAEPTVSRMEALNDLVGFDMWEGNPSTDKRVRHLLLMRFDGDKAKIEHFCREVLREVPYPARIFSTITGVELGALLQGFFIYFHVLAGTIDVTQKLTQQPMEQQGFPTVTPPKSRKSTARSKNKPSEC
ncbi:MAG: hypothetical protein WCK32_00740 [Chlorobiaceae bacterium]